MRRLLLATFPSLRDNEVADEDQSALKKMPCRIVGLCGVAVRFCRDYHLGIGALAVICGFTSC